TLKIQRNPATADKQHEVDSRDIGLAALFRGIADPQLRPEVEPHALADQGKRTRDQRLAGDDGRRRSDDDTRDEKPGRHNAIKGIAYSRIENPAPVLSQQPGALTQIV